jgi:enoyl-CoA hydratase
MNYQYLRIRTENRVGWLEYNRPPINAFNWEMLREMPAALEELEKDSQVRVIVVASAIEEYFNTGADVRVFDGIDERGISEWVTICHSIGDGAALRHQVRCQ